MGFDPPSVDDTSYEVEALPTKPPRLDPMPLCIEIILSDQHRCTKRDSNLGPSSIAVFEDCKATVLTTQPPQLDLERTF